MSRAAGSSLPSAGVVRNPDRHHRPSSRQRAQRAHQESPLVGDLGGDDRPGQRQRSRRVGEHLVLAGPQRHVLRGRGHDRGDELAIAFKNTTGTSASARVCSAWVETWTLPKTTTWRIEAIGTLLISRPVERDDQVLAALADVRTLLVEVEHGLVVVLGDDARQGDDGRDRRAWIRRATASGRDHGLGLVDQVEGFLGQADGGQRAAEAAVPKLGRQGLGGHVAGGQVANQGDRLQRSGAQRLVEGNLDAGLRADVVDESAGDRRRSGFPRPGGPGRRAEWRRFPRMSAGRPRLSEPPTAWSRPVESHRLVLRAGRACPMMPRRSEQSETLRVRSTSPSLRVRLASSGVVDPAVLEQAVLDELVDRHHRLDVFEVVEPRAIADLVQGPHRDQFGLIAAFIVREASLSLRNMRMGQPRSKLDRPNSLPRLGPIHKH